MIYLVPVFGWIIGLIFHSFLAIPFWFFWNMIAPVYLTFLPSAYHHMDFWDVVGFFVIISITKLIILPRGIITLKP